MPEFSQKSLNKLFTCHPDLQKLFLEVIQDTDCTIIEGYRTKYEQDKAFYSGNSQLKYPNGNHNTYPSTAVDVWPYPVPKKSDGTIDDNSPEWDNFARKVFSVADSLGIQVVWGGNWESLVDKPHWELKK